MTTRSLVIILVIGIMVISGILVGLFVNWVGKKMIQRRRAKERIQKTDKDGWIHLEDQYVWDSFHHERDIDSRWQTAFEETLEHARKLQQQLDEQQAEIVARQEALSRKRWYFSHRIAAWYYFVDSTGESDCWTPVNDFWKSP